MNRHLLRNTLAWVALGALSLWLAPLPAAAKKKPGEAAPAGNTMTFDTAETAAPAAAEPPRGKGKAGKGAAVVTSAPETAAGPASKVLDRALKLYDQEDYYSSTIELNKVVEGQTADDEANKQRAEFFMGKALFKLRFYSASLSYFDRIVQKGAGHRYYRKTLEWLASLSQYLPESAGVLEKIGKYGRADLDEPALEPVRDQLYYLLGRYHYTKANWKEALDLLQAVPGKSEYYAQSKFLEGMTYIRQQQAGQAKEAAKPASEAFKAILRKAKEFPDKRTAQFEEQANLALARTFYALGQYTTAVKYYDKIESRSPLWLPSLFESSWAQFQMDGDSKALGNIHTLNAPYFENEFYPESLILKSVIYFQRCNYDRAMEGVNEFNQTYPGLKKDIDAIIAKYPDNADFYGYILKIRDGEAGLGERVQRAAEGAVSDKTLAKAFDYVAELDRELKTVDRSDPAWKSTAVAGNILQDLTLQKSLAANDAGNMARDRLKRLSNEIAELVRQAIKVEYETLQAQKGVLEAEAKNEQVSAAAGAKKKGFGEVNADDEHQKWPFQGEYWKDELGTYRFKVANKCATR